MSEAKFDMPPILTSQSIIIQSFPVFFFAPSLPLLPFSSIYFSSYATIDGNIPMDSEPRESREPGFDKLVK